MQRSQQSPCRKADYRMEQLDDELLLYHPSNTVIMYCNVSASLVWQLCTGEHTTQEIISLLDAAYPQTEGNLAAEVEATLEQFAAHGAVEFVS